MVFFAVFAKLIRPGGALFFYEHHPIHEMIESGKAGAPIVWELSYFNKEPYADNDGFIRFGGGIYDAKPATSFSRTIAEVIMAGIHDRPVVEHFEELPHHICDTWWNVEESGLGLPMC